MSQQDADRGLIERLIALDPIRRYRMMRSALQEIAERSGGNYCESTVSYYGGRPCTSTCRALNSGRTRVATYGAYRWCDSCVAADALGLPPHAHPDAVDTWSD